MDICCPYYFGADDSINHNGVIKAATSGKVRPVDLKTKTARQLLTGVLSPRKDIYRIDL